MKYSICEGIDEQHKKEDQQFDAILSKNIIARMIRDREINWEQLESCLQDIEQELGTMNQPAISQIINSNYNL